MKNSIKRIAFLIGTSLLLAIGSASIVAPATYAADPTSTVCSTLQSGADCSTPANGINLNHVIAAVINIFSVVVGVVAVIMIIISGFKYVTSNGDSNKISSAKTTLIYAIVGLVIVAFAQVIVKFVLDQLYAPECPKGQVRSNGKCVTRKAAAPATYYYAVQGKRYALNFKAS